MSAHVHTHGGRENVFFGIHNKGLIEASIAMLVSVTSVDDWCM